ncbi:hypothetical protein ACFW3D_35250 [Streptomyces sp. NPDC058864]
MVVPCLLPGSTATVSELRLTYRTGAALLPRLMETCTRLGFRFRAVTVDRLPGRTDAAARVLFEVEGAADPGVLVSELFRHDGVIEVGTTSSGEE